MTTMDSPSPEQVVETAQNAKTAIETGTHQLVQIAKLTAIVLVVLFVIGLTINSFALWQFHDAQAAGHDTSKKILTTVTNHNTLLTQTLNAACVLIKSDPSLPVPAGCSGHFAGPHVHATVKARQ